ncbi:hypothetical protein QYE76_019129 [Lolium multiflorum]|uniref:Uncharacterized protein n=1 Tax=Lolium multiflorum TaxID=4521 RepID=A0AAD8R3F1_LOLMU|nr:hypothetical protein QYE76_019129 [Lolium multiflorum]
MIKEKKNEWTICEYLGVHVQAKMVTIPVFFFQGSLIFVFYGVKDSISMIEEEKSSLMFVFYGVKDSISMIEEEKSNRGSASTCVHVQAKMVTIPVFFFQGSLIFVFYGVKDSISMIEEEKSNRGSASTWVHVQAKMVVVTCSFGNPAAPATHVALGFGLLLLGVLLLVFSPAAYRFPWVARVGAAVGKAVLRNLLAPAD